MLRNLRPLLWSSLLLCVLLLSSCGIQRIGTIPRGTPDTGDGTPAVLPSPTLAVPAASASVLGSTYAFVRTNQLWVVLNGAAPRQLTNFNYSNQPQVFWHQPLWSPGDHFLAFISNAVPMGIGGGGCPAPDYSANGVLYVVNMQSGQATQITLPAVKKSIQLSGAPQTDYWQYAFWEDATHLLAWYNGVPGKVSSAAGLYRFDVVTQTLTQILPLSSLDVATLFEPQPNMPLLLSLRYSNEQLFYQVVVHPFGQQSQLLIYRRSLQQSQAVNSKVLQIGSEAWCASAQGAGFVRPGWDVSPNGEQIVSQTIVTASSNGSAVGAIQVLNMQDGVTTPLFSQAPTSFLSRNLQLTWGPDSQTVIASIPHTTGQVEGQGLYSATLADPQTMQQYMPTVIGQVCWRADGKAFALQDGDALDTGTPSSIYVFVAGETQGRVLLKNAREFAWG